MDPATNNKSRQSGSGLADLAAGLTKCLADANPSTNLVFSPLSIYAAVALLAPGARGATLDEVLRLLGARSRDELEESLSRMADDALQDLSGSGGPSVASACGVWNDKRRPLKPAYREAVIGTYRAEADTLDIRENAAGAAQHINAWVAEVTRNLIKDVISPESIDSADVVLANAIYFKGKWNLPFDERATRDRPFRRLDGTALDAPFMYNPGRHFIAVHDGFKVLKLQYKMSSQRGYQPYPWTAGMQYSMCIFLPDAYDGLGSLVDQITSRPGFMHDHLPAIPVKVGDFGVPKFKLDLTSKIAGILQQLGLVLPFGMGSDLSDMVDDDGTGLPLVVRDVIHKAVIEVSEEGTEAAALSMIIARGRGVSMVMPAPRVDFVADHPFAYFIVEEASGAIMFAGHVVDPSNGSGPVRTGKRKQEGALNEERLPARRFEVLPVTRNPPVHFDAVGPTGSNGLAMLAARLTRPLAEGSTDGNLVFSPLSIYTALALLAAGARNATLDEILRVLGARSRGELENFVSRLAADALQDRSASGGPRVAFACGVWSDLTRPLKTVFREAVVGTYKAEASAVDFRGAPEEARGQINAWASQATRNLINSVLPEGSIHRATQVVLGNAMYFKGTWEDQPFDTRHTAHRPFHRLDRGQVDVPFMQSRASQFVAVHHGFKVLKLRYKMGAPYQEGSSTTHHPPPLGRPDSDPYNYNGVGAPSPNYFPMRPPPYFHQPYYPPPPFDNPFSPYTYPRPYPPYGALGGVGYPPNPYFPRHDAFGNSYGTPNPRAGNAYPSQCAATPWAHSGSGRTRHTQFSMCIFLPDAHDGLWWLLDTMASRPGFLHDHLPIQRIALRELQMPKFKLSFHSSIAAILKKLGLQLPFSEHGDLCDMVEEDGSGLPIVVEDVIHKAVVEVTEEGTEAAAVTVGVNYAGCSRFGPPPLQVDFIADHPFAYYIMEEATGAVVFAGHVLDPSKE